MKKALPPIIFIDANIFIRFFTKDDPEKAEKVKDFFVNAENESIDLVTNILVFAEIEFVLRRHYKKDRSEITSILKSIFSIPNITVMNDTIVKSALLTYEDTKADIIDCINAAYLQSGNIANILSYDKHFDQFTNITRLKP